MMSIFSETVQRVTDYFLLHTDADGYQPILDVSRYQAPIDWEMMWESGVRLLILRLSVGNYYTDIEFENFITAAKAHGFKVGAYHVVKSSHSINSQWNRIMDSLGSWVLDMPLVLDCELDDLQNAATIATNIEGLINKYLTVFGVYPVIYTRANWWNNNTIYKPPFKHCPLWIARYTTLSHPWNDDPDNLKPRDWNTYALWQYSADGNGQGFAYGVGSDDVDLNRSSADDLDGTLDLLWGNTTPPPEPTPEGDYMFLADVVYLAPGTTYRNMRSKPDSTGSDAGLDVGDVTLLDKKMPVYEVQVNSEGEWYLVKKGLLVGWVLGKVGSIVYLKLTPLVPFQQVTALKNVNLHYWKDTNLQGKPLMVKPENPSKFLTGATFLVDPVKVDADGDEDYYKVLNPFNATQPALTPLAPWTGWYCKVSEVF